MPPPQPIICDMCGGKFFKNSIGIHQKQCAAKKIAQTVFCPICELPVTNDEYAGHVADCKEANKGKSKKKGQTKTVGTGVLPARYYERAAGIDVTKAAEAEKDKRVVELRGMIGGPCHACAKATATILCKACDCVMCVLCSDDVHDEDGPLASHTTERVDAAAAGAGGPAVPTDTRIPCEVCGRKFNDDRIAKHQVVCRKNAGKKPRKQFPSTEEMRLRGTDFYEYKGCRTEVEWKSRWREMHAEMMAIVPHHATTVESVGTGAPEVAGGAGAEPVEVTEKSATAAVALSDAMAGIIEAAEVKEAAAEKKVKIFTGDAVFVDGTKPGWLRYKGYVYGLPKGNWYGIEYEEAIGKHDGTWQEQIYFRCTPMHGAFVRSNKVTKREVAPEPVPEPAASSKSAATAAGAGGAKGEKKPRAADAKADMSAPGGGGDKPTASAAAAEGRPPATLSSSGSSFSLKEPKPLPPGVTVAAGSGIRAVRSLASTVHDAPPPAAAPVVASKKVTKPDSASKRAADPAGSGVPPAGGPVPADRRAGKAAPKLSPRRSQAENGGIPEPAAAAPSGKRKGEKSSSSRAMKGPSADDVQKAEIDRNVRYLQQLYDVDADANTMPPLSAANPGKTKAQKAKEGSHRLGGAGGTGVPGTGPGGALKQSDSVRDKRAAYFEKMFAEGGGDV